MPEPLSAKLKANEWVSAAMAVLGGKGGGKATQAQGTGAGGDKLPAAIDAASQFAAKATAA